MECHCFHQILTTERTLQNMLELLNERRELDVTFNYDKGEHDSVSYNIIFVPYHLCCTPAGSNDINDILHILGPSCHEFHKLGRGLNLDGSVMEGILYEARRSPADESLAPVLTKWLTWNYLHERFGKPSLSLVVKAVDTYDHQLAIKVFETFTTAAGEIDYQLEGNT